MTAELISRPVKTLCSSRQYSLFDEIVIEVVPESIAPSASGKPFIRFEAPDPRLSINGKPLREHLQQAGLSTPLKWRPLLQSWSFADFDAHYRPGGRPEKGTYQCRRCPAFERVETGASRARGSPAKTGRQG